MVAILPSRRTRDQTPGSKSRLCARLKVVNLFSFDIPSEISYLEVLSSRVPNPAYWTLSPQEMVHKVVASPAQELKD